MLRGAMGPEAATGGAHALRDTLAHDLARMVAAWGADSIENLLPRFEGVFDSFSDDDLAAFGEHFARAGEDG